MEYIYAALLLHSASKDISEENMKKIIKSTGLKADVAKVKSLITSLSSVDIDQILQSVTSITAAAPTVTPPPPGEEAPVEEKGEGKEEEEEKKEEEAFEGLGSLFG